MELLDIVDEHGQPTGEVVDRKEAHKKGIRHRTSHVWLMKVRDDCKNKELADIQIEDIDMLLQRRSDTKDSNPGCLDISSAGHIKAGTGYVESALRELKEELGVDAVPADLHFCGKKRVGYTKKFYGEDFVDCQISNVYIMYKDISAKDIVFQKEEVSEVMWKPFSEIKRLVEDKSKETCISDDEIFILEYFLKDNLLIVLDDRKRKGEL